MEGTVAVLVLLNNWMHDFSAAGWLVGSLLVWAILRRSPPEGEGREETVRILRMLLTVMRWSLAGIVLFGIGRVLAYREFEWSEAAGGSQIAVLAVKHVLLLGVFAWGLLWFLRARRFPGVTG